MSLAFALIACASIARLVSQALNESERLPLAAEALIWLPTSGVWLLDDPLVTLLWASLTLASSGVRMAGLPMRSWDGFRGALYAITASMLLLVLLPIASLAGLPSGVVSAGMLLAVVGVGVSLAYGLPRLGLLSSDRVQHSRVIQAMSDGVLIVDMNGGLDDFGTGYSSLSYLRRFTIDRAKVDRSFVAELMENPDDAALTSAIIAMAHGLRLKVVAEGVETAAHALFLRQRSCDEPQGYLFGRPCPADEFVERLRARPIPIHETLKDEVDDG